MERMAITSRDNERVKTASKLAASPAARAEAGLFFAEGPRLCLDLAQSLGCEALFATEKALAAWPALCEVQCPVLYEVADHVAEKLGGTTTPQGVFGLFGLPRCGLDDLDLSAGVLLCEKVQDPANIGTMLRTAAGLGYGGAVLCGCADPFAPKALRAGMGAVGRLPVVVAPNPEAAAQSLKAGGCTLVAATLQNAVPLGGVVTKGPPAVLVGNEGAGLSEGLQSLADKAVCIPMAAGVESLNAAAAAAILMYHFKQ